MESREAGKPETFAPFDIADYLETEEDIIEYLAALLEEGDPRAIAAGLGLSTLRDLGTASGFAVFALLGLGVVLIYKSSGVLNFAHGLFLSIGAYATWLAAERMPMELAIAVGVAVGALTAVLVELVMIRPLYTRTIEQVLVTVGLSLAGVALLQAVFGADPRPRGRWVERRRRGRGRPGEPLGAGRSRRLAAQHPLREREVLVEEGRRVRGLRSLADVAPEPPQVGHVVRELGVGRLGRGRGTTHRDCPFRTRRSETMRGGKGSRKPRNRAAERVRRFPGLGEGSHH